MKTQPKKVQCPSCRKEVVWNEQSPYRPFCSTRCQQIDFGDWASENYSIPGSPAMPDDLLDADDHPGNTEH